MRTLGAAIFLGAVAALAFALIFEPWVRSLLTRRRLWRLSSSRRFSSLRRSSTDASNGRSPLEEKLDSKTRKRNP